MSVLVRFGKQKAILRQGVWVSADAEFERLLNATTEKWIQATGGPPITDRDHERTVAKAIAEELGGRVLLRVKTSRKQAARLYISRRQLHLDFA